MILRIENTKLNMATLRHEASELGTGSSVSS